MVNCKHRDVLGLCDLYDRLKVDELGCTEKGECFSAFDDVPFSCCENFECCELTEKK